MLLVGLTGGIATGKSTIGKWLSELGAYLVDADLLAHEVLAPNGAAYDAVVADFGPGILASDLSIDREKLGVVVFGSPSHLQRLNALVHPHVRAEASRLFFAREQRESHSVGIFEAALLVETGGHQEMDRLIVTYCEPETQVQRLLDRGLQRADAELRLGAQLPHARKRELADFAIDSEASQDETRSQVREIWRQLRDEALAG